MPMTRIERDIYQVANRLTIRALATIAAAVGIAILAGGPARFNNTPSLATAAQAPGGWVTWGVLDLAVGIWTIVWSVQWRRREVMFGLLAQSILFTFWTITIAVSAFQSRTAPLTGIAVYGGYSLTCAISYVTGHELRAAGHR